VELDGILTPKMKGAHLGQPDRNPHKMMLKESKNWIRRGKLRGCLADVFRGELVRQKK